MVFGASTLEHQRTRYRVLRQRRARTPFTVWRASHQIWWDAGFGDVDEVSEPGSDYTLSDEAGAYYMAPAQSARASC